MPDVPLTNVSTTANVKIGVSYNAGASSVHTIQLVRAEYIQ